MNFHIYEMTVGSRYETWSEPVDRHLGDAPRCPVCRRYVGMKAWLPPYRVDFRVFGRELADVVERGVDLIVSDRFRRCFEDAGLSGLEFHQLEVRKSVPKRLTPEQGYFFARIARGRAAVDVAKSGLERGPMLCPECRTMMDVERAARIVMEEGTWDGLDVFIPRGLPGRRIVSERFKEMCTEKGIKGLDFKSAAEYSFDSMPWRRDWPKT